MKYRQLGRTGIRVSEIGFGSWAIGGPVDVGFPVGWGKVDDQESISAIRRAVELGINFFDTADVYGNGHSEDLLREGLHGTNAVIATKVGNSRDSQGHPVKDFSEQHIRKALDGSLKRLQRESIELYQLHNPPPDIWKSDAVFDVLKELKQEGKIKSYGVSISTMEEGIHLIENGKAEVIQVLFNILNQEPARKLIPLAQSHGVGLITRVPLASGLLTGKFSPDHRFPRDDNRINYLSTKRFHEALDRVEELKQLTSQTGYTLPQIALAFILKFEAVSSVIPGAKNAGQVEQNAAASNAFLSDELFKLIRKQFMDYNFYLRYQVRV